MAYAEPEDQPFAGRVGNQCRCLSANVRVAQIDARNPWPHFDAAGDRAHQLRRRQSIIVDFRIEDRLKAGIFGFAGDGSISRARHPIPGTIPNASRSVMITSPAYFVASCHTSGGGGTSERPV